MPNQQAESPQTPAPPTPQTQPPVPVKITPALLKTHSITNEEYVLIEKALGRTPSITELGIFSVMWSEHCSYKSSRVHLKRLPTKGTRLSGPGSVIQGPGENAGIIDVGDGWACAFKIESHNHPSYIEPYQGAATGVGGILRDIFTMGARPLAVMDSLRFGPLTPGESEPVPGIDYARNRQTMTGVVHGVGGYGNCFGVPNLGGETRFEPCYSGNPLLNAFALGLVRTDEIFYAKAEGVGNPVFYVGAKTGRDGIHGATMASEEFTEGSEQKRPNVQMGDPFLEKLLLEACLEVMKTGAVLGIQDMGAAGLTCSTCEMGARGSLGVTIELDRVPQREASMTTYEIMLSESQERMLLVAAKGREEEVLAVFRRWGLDCAEVGIVTADDVMRVYHGGVLEAEIPNKALTDDAPVYHRPVGTWDPPIPKDAPAWVLEELKRPRDYTADLKKLLASANICDKRFIFEQYDSMVQTNTVQGPGGEAGVIRIKGTGALHASPNELETPSDPAQEEGFIYDLSPVDPIVTVDPVPFKPNGIFSTLADYIGESSVYDETGLQATDRGPRTTDRVPERGLAMALAGNGRWCYLDPKLGAMHAVAEAARKVACTGATPVAATNCLNFGNPQKPEIMAQLSQAIDGIAEACTALGTPVTGGNVSLYNETLGEGIYPTPVIGVVGILDDVTKAVPNSFQQAGDVIYIVQGLGFPIEGNDLTEFGSSEFAKTILGAMWGTPGYLSLFGEAELQAYLTRIATEGIATSASDVSDGGYAVALARATFAEHVGASVNLHNVSLADETWMLFSERAATALLTCKPEHAESLERLADSFMSLHLTKVGVTGEKGLTIIITNEARQPTVFAAIDVSLTELRTAYSNALESQLAEEVFA